MLAVLASSKFFSICFIGMREAKIENMQTENLPPVFLG